MTIAEKTFTAKFVDATPRILLELTNESQKTLRTIEILTIFLKADETPGDHSEAHIRFDAVNSMLPQQTSVVAHRTWIDGRPVNDARDQMNRVKFAAGETNPYVLNISWQDPEGKARFQRIPVSRIN
jgi:hypothetical protein